MKKVDCLILGAGLTGLSLALKLLRRNKRVCIVEKEPTVGGLAKSYKCDGVVFDFGPHVFRSENGNLIKWVTNLTKMIPHQTKVGIFKYSKIFNGVIPIIPQKNIELLPTEVKNRVLCEIDSASILGKSSDNFEETIKSQIGETLYQEFFGQYSAKWWGVNPRRLSASLAPKNLRIGNSASYAHISTDFSTPRKELHPETGGYGSISNILFTKVLELKGEVLCSKEVTQVVFNDNHISEIVCQDGETIKVSETCYSTIPIIELCRLLNISTTLSYRSDICIYVVAKTNTKVRRITRSWLYFPERDVLFSRLSDTSRFSLYNSPKDKIGLCAEVPCFTTESAWNSKNLAENIVDQLIDLGFLTRNSLIKTLTVKERYAYPILTIDYALELARLKHLINQEAKNLVLAGRTGAFNYQNSDAALAYSLTSQLKI